MTLKLLSDHDGAVSAVADSLRADSLVAVSRSDCDVKCSGWQSYYRLNFILYRDKSPRGVINI